MGLADFLAISSEDIGPSCFPAASMSFNDILLTDVDEAEASPAEAFATANAAKHMDSADFFIFIFIYLVGVVCVLIFVYWLKVPYCQWG